MLNFEQIIPTELSPQRVWELFEHSFRDSVSSPLWPDHLEVLRCERFAKGERVVASYKMGLFTAKQSYILQTCDPIARELVYRTTQGHPLSGGGHVTITAYGSGARIHWRGAYALKPRLTAIGSALYTSLYFEQRFFDAIATNLRRIEDAARAQQRQTPAAAAAVALTAAQRSA